MTTFSAGKALVIGISAYEVPLPAAVANDARDLAALLRDPSYCGYGSGAVRLLLDEEATKAAIQSELAKLAADAVEDDTVVIFYSGHGDVAIINGKEQGCLVPVDADTKGDEKLLSSDELTAALRAIKAKRVVLFMDACFSGRTGSLKSRVIAGKSALSDVDYGKLASGEGRVVISSSRGSEVSFVYDHMRNSVFTDALLRALRGAARSAGDGLVRIFDVFDYISQRVPDVEPRQQPMFKGDAISKNFPLALLVGGAKTPARGPAPRARDDAWWKRVETVANALYPAGPNQSELWSRAGGDVSVLSTSQNARGLWHNALKALRAGGGGANISPDTLLAVMREEFSGNDELADLQRS